MKSKDALQKIAEKVINIVVNQKGKNVKRLQSYDRGKYTGQKFEEYLKKKSITRRLTIP